MAKKITAKPKKHTKRDAIIGIGLLVLVAVIAYGIFYVPYSIQKDKQRFLDAKPYLESIKTRVEDTIGKADSTTHKEDCNRANLKSSKGPLICSSAIELVFENENSISSSSIATQIAQNIGTDIHGSQGQTTTIEFTVDEIGSTQQDFSQTIDGLNSLNCSILYRYINNPLGTREPIGERLSIYLSCSGKAKREYFN